MQMPNTTPGGTAGRPLFPRWFFVVYLVAFVVFLISAVLAHSANWLIFWVIAGVVNMLVFAYQRQRLAKPPSAGPWTGRTLTSPDTSNDTFYAARAASRWIGGANMIGTLGRVSATGPFGVLELSQGRLTLDVKPRWLAKVFGLTPLSVTADEVSQIFPAKGQLRSPGVGIFMPDRHVSYFFTGRREEILAALQAAHFPVSWDERRFSN
jgi:hypothetical protein